MDVTFYERVRYYAVASCVAAPWVATGAICNPRDSRLRRRHFAGVLKRDDVSGYTSWFALIAVSPITWRFDLYRVYWFTAELPVAAYARW